MIIGLGYQARSGKDTVASYLISKYGFVQESFAEPLKNICRDICGLSDKHLYGTWKEMLIPEYQLTSRELLQKIGAAMRTIHPDFWVLHMKRRIKDHMKNGVNLIVVSDVRHINEAKMIKSFGGIMIKTNRNNPDKITNPNHISETQMKSYDKWDYQLDNNGTYEQLYEQIDKIMKDKLNE
jgi:hypothetical protein